MLALLAKLLIGWAIVIAVSFYLTTQVQGWELEYTGILVALALVNIAWRFWEIRSISYRVSSQRLEITRGKLKELCHAYYTYIKYGCEYQEGSRYRRGQSRRILADKYFDQGTEEERA